MPEYLAADINIAKENFPNAKMLRRKISLGKTRYSSERMLT